MSDSEDDEIPELINTVDDTSIDQGSLSKKVPITIVTGYLGAGKTTLLNYILTAEHGKKIAVLLNEFGNTTDIEKSLTVSQEGKEAQEWIPLANGCICCSVKDSGVAALEALVERQKNFDYILLETTGVADPGNIAPMFWMDEGLASSIYLDGVVTVVDAKNILKSLDEPTPEELPQEENDSKHHDHSAPLMSTAHLQISHADVILLNKVDLVTGNELDMVKQRILSINGLAKIIVTDHSKVNDLSGTLLDIYAYTSFPQSKSGPDFASKGHSHLDPTISTITIDLPIVSKDILTTMEEWLQMILWPSTEEKPYEVHRTKGLVHFTGGSSVVIQGVREIFEIIQLPETRENQDDVQNGRVVFIGRNLQHIPRQIPWAFA